ncbi:MAG: glycosyltransferase [Anaerolineae bacterium]|nr:glycosyltransferase [Anaerolineae bacterium]
MSRLAFSYYSDLVFPSSAASSRQVAKTVDALQRGGAEVRLFIPIPWKYRRLTALQRLERLRQYYGLSGNFKVDEMDSPLPMVKKIHRFPMIFRATKIIGASQTDVLCVRNFWHLKIGLARGFPILYETYKYKNEARRTLSAIKWLNERANFIGVILHSDLARNYWLSQGANPEKVTTIHNGIDAAEIADAAGAKRAESRQMLNLPEDARIISYSGNMGKNKGVEAILGMARYLPDITFMLVGYNGEKDKTRLNRLANQLGLRNIKMYPWMAPTEVEPFLRAADAVLIPPTGKPLHGMGKTVLPIKTFVYLASGAALLAPDLDDTAEILEHGRNAFLLKPDAPEENGGKVRLFFENETLMNAIAENALTTAKEYTWHQRAMKIIAFAETRFSIAKGS